MNVDNARAPGAMTWAADRASARVDSLLREFSERKDQVLARGLDPTVWRRATADIGLPGLDLPPEVGGVDWAAVEMAHVFRECGGIDLNLRDLPGGGHARMLEPGQHPDILRRVTLGEAFLAVAITEASAGSDMRSIQTVARRVDGGYVLTGSKSFVARLDQASHAVVFAKLETTPTTDLTALLVPVSTTGVTRRSIPTLGLNQVSFGQLDLDEVTLPASALVGSEGQATGLFRTHFTYWRACMAAAAIGSADAVMTEAREWLRSRTAFGGPIGRFTHLQQSLAKHHARLRMGWLLVLDAMSTVDRRTATPALGAMVKAEVIEICIAAVEWAISSYGARGYTLASGLPGRLSDLLGLRIADGTTDLLRSQVAREILGDDIYHQSLGRSAGG